MLCRFEDLTTYAMISNQYRLLLVEDSFAEIRLIEEAIKESGLGDAITLKSFQNPELVMDHLLSALEENSLPDLVLLDLNMPRMHGIELLKEIKECDGISPVPVYILTNSDNKMDMAEAYQANADGYVQKPTDFDQFVAFFSALRKSIELKDRVSILYLDKFYQEAIKTAI